MSAKNVREELWAPLVRVEGVPFPMAGLPCLFKDAEYPEVPLPKLFTLQWTDPTSTGNGSTHFPPTDRDLIIELEPQEKPATYKAAVDAIRVANDFFVKSGCGSGREGPNSFPDRQMLFDLGDEYFDKYEQGEEPDFNEPPDLRILWVTDKNYHPSDKNIPWNSRLWVVACQRYHHKLNNDEKADLIRKTHSELQKEYERSFSDVKIYNKFIINIFMKYMAHLELDKFKTESWINKQPTSAELDAFFSAPENANGVTLYDLHRTFYNATDMEEFVKHIEVFATHVPCPPDNPNLKERPEGVYMRKKIPTVQQIESVLNKPTTFPQIFQDLASRYQEYANGVGSQAEVFDRVLELATPDMTTGRLIRKKIGGSVNCPSINEIHDTLRTVGPISFYDLASSFPDHIASQEHFEGRLRTIAAVDLTTGNHILKEKPQPTAQEIHRVLVEQVDEQPLSTDDLIRFFPNQVWNKKKFEDRLAEVAYKTPVQAGQDGPTEWLPLRTGGLGSHEFLSEYDSGRLNGLEHLLRIDLKKVLEWVGKAAHWDGSAFIENPSSVKDTSKLELQPDPSKNINVDFESGPTSPARSDSTPPPGATNLTPSATSPIPPLPSNKRKQDSRDVEEEDNTKSLGAQENSPRSKKKPRLENDSTPKETVPSSADLPPSNRKSPIPSSKAPLSSPTVASFSPPTSPSIPASFPVSPPRPSRPRRKVRVKNGD